MLVIPTVSGTLTVDSVRQPHSESLIRLQEGGLWAASKCINVVVFYMFKVSFISISAIANCNLQCQMKTFSELD